MTRFGRGLKNSFGSKKGMVRFAKHQLLWYFGHYDRLSNINFQTVQRLIFICEGNICRSPVAALVAQSQGVRCVSFGLSCTDNHPADPRAVAFAKQIGLDLTHHRTRNIAAYIYQPGDLLVGMEPRHLPKISRVLGTNVPTTLLGLFRRPPLTYLHDPFNSSLSFFNRCEEHVVAATEGLLQKAIWAHEENRCKT
jgi:protein-tyrosine phosphatase